RQDPTTDTIPVVGYAFPRRAWERGSWWVLRQPRRRESISRVGVYLEQWIPACARMTMVHS
nr:hypothetical protein [Endozoicomonas sp.]